MEEYSLKDQANKDQCPTSKLTAQREQRLPELRMVTQISKDPEALRLFTFGHDTFAGNRLRLKKIKFIYGCLQRY